MACSMQEVTGNDPGAGFSHANTVVHTLSGGREDSHYVITPEFPHASLPSVAQDLGDSSGIYAGSGM
jgi:hypothetical protein